MPRPDYTKQARPKWVVNPSPSRDDFRAAWTRVNSQYNPSRRVIGDGNTRYARYLNSVDWLRFRVTVLVLAGFHCADCPDEASEVHHLNYQRVGSELLTDVVPLCRDCHESRHGGSLGIGLKQVLDSLTNTEASQ